MIQIRPEQLQTLDAVAEEAFCRRLAERYSTELGRVCRVTSVALDFLDLAR